MRPPILVIFKGPEIPQACRACYPFAEPLPKPLHVGSNLLCKVQAYIFDLLEVSIAAERVARVLKPFSTIASIRRRSSGL